MHARELRGCELVEQRVIGACTLDQRERFGEHARRFPQLRSIDRQRDPLRAQLQLEHAGARGELFLERLDLVPGAQAARDRRLARELEAQRELFVAVARLRVDAARERGCELVERAAGRQRAQRHALPAHARKAHEARLRARAGEGLDDEAALGAGFAGIAALEVPGVVDGETRQRLLAQMNVAERPVGIRQALVVGARRRGIAIVVGRPTSRSRRSCAGDPTTAAAPRRAGSSRRDPGFLGGRMPCADHHADGRALAVRHVQQLGSAPRKKRTRSPSTPSPALRKPAPPGS